LNSEFFNVYGDSKRADAYASLEFPGTYYLAYRDLPHIIDSHVTGKYALDFGCGAGRSTRFLKKLGFDSVVGVDIAEQMLIQARDRDPNGDYRLVCDGDLSEIGCESYDLILSVFTFDNIPTMDKKVTLFRSLKQLLKSGGRIISLVSSPDIYVNEWASFSTSRFPENRTAVSGDKVRIVMLDVKDSRPVEDIIWSNEDYLEVYRRAGLKSIKKYDPMASSDEPYNWVSETTIAPWAIYVLERDE